MEKTVYEPLFTSTIPDEDVKIDLTSNNKSIIICMNKIYHSLNHERDIDTYLKRNDYSNLFRKMKKKIGTNKIQSIVFSYLAVKYDRGNIDIDELSNYLSCSNLYFLTFMNEIEKLEKMKLVVFDRKENNINFKIPIEIIEYLSKYDELPDLNSNFEKINYFNKNKTSDYAILNNSKEEKRISSLITKADIITKEMFYNKEEEEEINKLKLYLQEENLQGIKERLRSRKMNTGFTCMFSGEPGTGKTETALQLAKETKRDLIKIDIANIRASKYGKVEKNVKRIFSEYNELLETSDIAPILFINEADGLIGKRRGISKRNGSIDQTENTMTNIMLEEMESFKGILIATTNLLLNMDTAFDRRFLYKIEFKKPGLDVRKNILKLFVPELTDEMAQELSLKYELTGGQIENISRKLVIDYIMRNEDVTMEKLLKYSKSETNSSFKEKTIRIGFNTGD